MSVIPVTVVVPVRNEAQNLPACLASLAGVTEVVVADSGSSDDTVAIAEAHGARVVAFRWNGRFPKKRNWVLRAWRFTTDWVLFLDADERLTPAFKVAMAEAIRRDDIAGYWLNYRNHFMGRVLRHGVRQKKLALFRVAAGAYERIEEENWSGLDMEVHEHPVLNGTVGEIGAPIEHFDFRGTHHFVERHNAYATWEAWRFLTLRAAADTARETMTRRQRGKYRYLDRAWFPLAYFLMTYVVRLGVLDGSAGFHYAMLKAIYFYHIRLKILERRSPSVGEVACTRRCSARHRRS